MSHLLENMIPWADQMPDPKHVLYTHLAPQSLYGALLRDISSFSEEDVFKLHVRAGEIKIDNAKDTQTGPILLLWRDRILNGHELVLAGLIASTLIPALIISTHWNPYHASARA